MNRIKLEQKKTKKKVFQYEMVSAVTDPRFNRTKDHLHDFLSYLHRNHFRIIIFDLNWNNRGDFLNETTQIKLFFPEEEKKLI